jgi:hypothetical protein
MKMKEDFLHYLWKFKLFDTSKLLTNEGVVLEVINFGLHNTDAGPDFFNGKVRIGATTWAGNIEMHINSSDWTKHKHEQDNAYHNVILHVVYNNDAAILDKNGNAIPTLELKHLIRKEILTKYEHLVLLSDSPIPCGGQLKTVDAFTIQSWMNRLAIERLERKSEEIRQTLEQNKNDWETTFYHYLLKYFGLTVNALPFELLAKNTGLKIIEKHHKLLSIEALLYGQAGYLAEEVEGEYFQQLKKEYQFLKSKFDLTPMDKSLWKMLRLRPHNFPTLRISQLANLLAKETRLFSKLMATESIKEMQEIFNVQASNYWNNHYQFGKLVSENKRKKIGIDTLNILLINVVVPFTFVYGKEMQNEVLIDKSITLLESVSSEKNSIVRQWNKLGIYSNNALQSQSLIELKNNYCSQKKCLNCSIGNKILQND